MNSYTKKLNRYRQN